MKQTPFFYGRKTIIKTYYHYLSCIRNNFFRLPFIGLDRFPSSGTNVWGQRTSGADFAARAGRRCGGRGGSLWDGENNISRPECNENTFPFSGALGCGARGDSSLATSEEEVMARSSPSGSA